MRLSINLRALALGILSAFLLAGAAGAAAGGVVWARTMAGANRAVAPAAPITPRRDRPGAHSCCDMAFSSGRLSGGQRLRDRGRA